MPKLPYGFNLSAQLLHGPQRGAYAGKGAWARPTQPGPFSTPPGRRPVVNPKIPFSLRTPAAVNPGFIPTSPLGAARPIPTYTPVRMGVQKHPGYAATPSTTLTLNRGMEPMKASIPFQPQPGPKVAFKTAIPAGVSFQPAPIVAKTAVPVTTSALAPMAKAAGQTSVANQGVHIDNMADAQALYQSMRYQDMLNSVQAKAAAQASRPAPVIIQQGAPAGSSLPGISAKDAMRQLDLQPRASAPLLHLKPKLKPKAQPPLLHFNLQDLMDANHDGYVSATEQSDFNTGAGGGGSDSGGGSNPLEDTKAALDTFFFNADGSAKVGRMALVGAAAAAIAYAASRSK